MNPDRSPSPILRWREARAAETAADLVVVEEPLEVRVRGRSVAVLMRTPGHDRELTAGFLFTEGILRRAEDLLDLLPCREQPRGEAGNVVEAVLAPGVAVDFERLTRPVFTSSSCGVCGTPPLDALFRTAPPLAPGPRLDPRALTAWPARIRGHQPLFAATGGAHGCALLTPEGRIDWAHEDAGRHNAVDKAIGAALLAGALPLSGHGLMLSGRISFELVQKALLAGVPVVAGIGAPSSLAIACARRAGLTLAGFVREDRFNVYAGAERLGLEAPA
ncbi:MAG: formate dehydrogenase accessory sulfurtransferase FdhD [Opitutaceae bacterium]